MISNGRIDSISTFRSQTLQSLRAQIDCELKSRSLHESENARIYDRVPPSIDINNGDDCSIIEIVGHRSTGAIGLNRMTLDVSDAVVITLDVSQASKMIQRLARFIEHKSS